MNVAVQALRQTGREQHISCVISQLVELRQAGHSFPALHDLVQELERTIFSFDGEKETAEEVLDSLASEQFSILTDAYSAWETELEWQFAQRVISGEVQISDYLLFDRFDELLRRELALVQGAQPRRILFIGSGPVPISAIHMHLQTGVPVDCIDRDVNTVALSRQLLGKAGFSESIRVFCDKGEDHDVSQYDLILVALLAKPKRNILKNLRKRAKPTTHILCRTSMGLRRLVYEPTVDRDVYGFHISSQQVAVGEQTISTWLLQQSECAAADVNMIWLNDIDTTRARQLLHVMNRVLADETTIGFPGPVDEEKGMTMMRQLGEDVVAGRRHVLVAEKSGTIVGQLILTPNPLPNCSHIVELSRGIIDPSMRGGGLALRAFQEITKKCDELGRELICLDVREGTLAAMWWRHFGFQPFGSLRDYARVNGKSYTGLYMTQTNQALKNRLAQMAENALPPSASVHDNGHNGHGNGNGGKAEMVLADRPELGQLETGAPGY